MGQKPVRIAHIFPHLSWGGAEIQMLDIAQWQTESGLDVCVWCTQDSPIHQEALKRGLRTITDSVPVQSPFPPLLKLARVINREGFTHLHIHWASGLRVFLGIKLFCDVKIFFYTHMWITKRKRDPLHHLAYSQVDKWTVSGPRAKAAVLKHLAVREDQLEFISYGVDFRKIPQGIRIEGRPRPGLREPWGVPEDALLFGFMGRIDRQKGVAEFVQAMGPLLGEFPNLHLMLIGSPTLNEEDAAHYNNEVDQLIKEIPEAVRPRLHRFPHQRDFITPLACLDLLIVPSYMESYSILITQAFTLGIPVLSTDAGGTPDLVSPPLRGWLVPPRTVHELRECARALVQNPKQLIERSEACLSYARDHHSHHAVVKRLNQIYGLET